MKRIILALTIIGTIIGCQANETGPSTPDWYVNGIPFVDLGLASGTLWALYNVGAQSEYEPGNYYAWGETEPKNQYDWENYKYFIHYDPYNTPAIELENIGKCISGTEHDAATVNWDNRWAMPDSIQLREMKYNTSGVRVVCHIF